MTENTKKINGLKIDRRESLPTVDRKLGVPAQAWGAWKLMGWIEPRNGFDGNNIQSIKP